MSGVDTDLLAEIGDRANVFLLAPTFGSGAERWCSSLLGSAAAADGAVLYVTDGTAPDALVDRWREHHDGLPARMGFVVFDSTARGDGQSSVVEAELEGTDVQLRAIDSPGNLTKLGVELNALLADWSEAADDLVICFDSLTAMIQYGDVETVYRFLHVLSNQVRGSGAHAHYHLDPTAHEPTDVNLLTTTSDAVVEWDGDDVADVRTR